MILDANPLEDIRNASRVNQVMQNGRLYDGATMDQVWPEEKALEPMWFWDTDPERRGGAE